ncbi:Microsomal glutathione S-transferase 3 [Chytridiales sp. JEL 0842]|nr:Microsomal glutathione S-transferase 3 [Chytridiales sp. JEL 0842]
MVAINLAPEYGYVVAVGAFNSLVLLWMGGLVGGARKRAGIPYPYMYAERAEAEKDKNKHLFNCAQRAHLNTLENNTMFLTLLFTGGVEHPTIAAVAGAVYLAGRISYANGYCTGEPSKRQRGAYQYLGLLTLLILSFKTGVNMVLSGRQ